MEHSSSHKLSTIEPYTFLNDALTELKRKIVESEPVIALKYRELLPHIELLREQTVDFLQMIQANTIVMSEQSKSEIDEPVEISNIKNKVNPAYQNIVIKVSSHQYVPKVLHPQTIVTYKSELQD